MGDAAADGGLVLSMRIGSRWARSVDLDVVLAGSPVFLVARLPAGRIHSEVKRVATCDGAAPVGVKGGGAPVKMPPAGITGMASCSLRRYAMTPGDDGGEVVTAPSPCRN